MFAEDWSRYETPLRCSGLCWKVFALLLFPLPRLPELMLPVHFLHLVEMGLTQGQNFDLEALAADCDADGRYSFLLSASPEPVVGGYGAPVNPVAIK